jgi:anti-anti-sigma regulatory factor
MPLSLERRRVGHIAVVTCAGHLVEGAEVVALEHALDELLQFGPYLMLHLGAVEFVDSAGVGLLQAYVREMLRQNGYAVMTAGNLPDAVILMKAVKPKLLIVSADLRGMRSTHAAQTFSRLADSLTVIELPADFSHRDAGEAGSSLLERIRAVGRAS